MEIFINQTKSGFKNEFEIYVNEHKEYLASTPILELKGGILQFDKTLPIKITDLSNNMLFESSYNVVDNFKEEFMPFDYLNTKEQKIDQFIFNNDVNKEHCQIYFVKQEPLKWNYVIKQDGKYYEAYAKNNGYYKNVPIFYNGNQIAEIVKLNVVIDGNDTYTIFLKDEYEFLKDSLIAFTLYLDRLYFNYGFTKNSYVTYSKTYSKNDNKYNPNWLKENFDTAKFYNECEKIIEDEKNKVIKSFVIIGAILVIFTLILLAIIVFLK